MKRTLLIVFINLILICSMALSVSAQNGQAVFFDRSINAPNTRYGIKLDSPFVASGGDVNKDIVFQLNTGERVNLYITPMNSFNSNTSNITYYRQSIIDNDILHSQEVWVDGSYTIHVSNLRLSIGTYRLTAIGTLDSDSNMYEAYFFYVGATQNVLSHVHSPHMTLSLKYDIKQSDGSLSAPYTVYENTDFDSLFYTEQTIPASVYNNSKQVNVYLNIDDIHVYPEVNPPSSLFYGLYIKNLCLTGSVEYELKRFPICNVYIKNRTTGSGNVQIATLNNINTIQSQSSEYPYALYIPSDLIQAGDDITVMFSFPCYVLASFIPDDSVFSFSLKVDTILLDTFSGTKDYSGAYNAMDDLDSLGEQLNSVERPELSMDDLDITDFVSAQDIANASLAIRYLDNTHIFLSVTALVAIFTIISYLFFGKKGA